jgi:hypothetical protein
MAQSPAQVSSGLRGRHAVRIGVGLVLALSVGLVLRSRTSRSDEGSPADRASAGSVGDRSSSGHRTSGADERVVQGLEARASGSERRAAATPGAESTRDKPIDADEHPSEVDVTAGHEFRCSFVDARDGSPVEGVLATLTSREMHTLDALRSSETRSDELGRVHFAPIEVGAYELAVNSEWYRELKIALAIDESTRTPPPISLERLPIAEVQLIGGLNAELAEYQISRLGHSLHAPVAVDWTAVLPWPDGTEPSLTVHGPGSLEIVALFAGVDPTTEPLSVRVGDGEALEVTVVGQHDDTSLVLVLWFASAIGYEAFVTKLVTPGTRERFDFCEPGDVWIDVGVQRPDRTIQPLGRTRATIERGKPCAATVDIGRTRTYAVFEGAPGERLREGNLYLAVEGDLETSPAGGPLDEDGRLVVPVRAEREFFVIGTTGSGSSEAVVADVHVAVDSLAGHDVLVSLGAIQESEVELVDVVTGASLGPWRFDVVGGTTSQLCTTAQTGVDGAPALVRWHSHGAPCFELLWDGIWAPRGPVPIPAGRVRIAITLRAECTFFAASRSIADVRHVASGLDQTGLLAYGGVQVEDRPEGRHFAGIPAGPYVVRLEGEEVWRGPFAVTSGEPCRVDVPDE